MKIPSLLLDRVVKQVKGPEELHIHEYVYQNYDGYEDLKKRFQLVRMTQYADGSVKYECSAPKDYKEKLDAA